MGQIKSFLIKVSYSIGANLLSLGVSVLTTLLVPKFLGKEFAQYGYLQIYLFYCGYLGFFHFGLCDGVFLRYGGKLYKDLDKPMLSSQFWLLVKFEIILSAIIVICMNFFTNDSNYRFIIIMLTGNLTIFLPRTLLQNYLQTTNRIKEYASITTAGRTIYGILIVVIVAFLSISFKWFVIADLVGKSIALGIGIWWCRDIVFCMPVKPKIALAEMWDNVSVGSKLMFANIAGLLITGIVQWGIQLRWDASVYGKIAFTLNISNLLITFISAVSLVLYPTLRRTSIEKLPKLYGVMRNSLMFLLLGCLILYYPVRVLLSAWLPQYAESMSYMAILFPLCIYAAKMTLLVQTYMNVYRMEKQMMKINLIGVGVAISTTVISVLIMENLTLAMISIVVNQIFRCVFAENVLAKQIRISVNRDIILEVFLTVVFIVVSWWIGGWVGVLLYEFAYLSYMFIKKGEIKEVLMKIFKR